MARHFTVRRTLEEYWQKVRAVEEPALRAQLEQFATILFLDHVERDIAWFVSARTIAPESVSLVGDEIDRLCAAIRPHVGELIATFGVPEQSAGGGAEAKDKDFPASEKDLHRAGEADPRSKTRKTEGTPQAKSVAAKRTAFHAIEEEAGKRVTKTLEFRPSPPPGQEGDHESSPTRMKE